MVGKPLLLHMLLVQTISNIKLNSFDLNVNKTPYSDKITLYPSPWLISNPMDFMTEIHNKSGTWGGEGQLGDTVDENVSTRQNRRLDW